MLSLSVIVYRRKWCHVPEDLIQQCM